MEKNLSTEERFLEAARKVFSKKGYAGTKTRDIAQEAGLNLALLNYYFRSKEKLFERVMAEKLQQLFSFLAPALNDSGTSLSEKIEWIAANYIDMLIKNPDLPLFVLSEIRNNPEKFGKAVQLDSFILKSHFMKQVTEKKTGINPVHFFINFLGMLVFPFIIQPVFQATGAVGSEAYIQLLKERKTFIPVWIMSMLE